MANIAARRPSRTVAARHPDVTLREVDVDAMAAELCSRPDSFEVILTSKMYGDILSKLANPLAGGVGLASARNVGETHAAAAGGRTGRGHAQGVTLAVPACQAAVISVWVSPRRIRRAKWLLSPPIRAARPDRM